MPPRAPRRVLRGAAAVGAVLLAYGGGVLTGVVGSGDRTAATAGAETGPRGTLDEAADRIAGGAAREVSRDELERAAVEGMLKSLGDRWSSYYAAGDYTSFKDGLEGRYTGVGLWLRPAVAGGVEVGSVQAGTPAATAHVQAGERVLAVDGQPVESASVAAVSALLHGADGTPVLLRLRGGGSERETSLLRASFDATDVAVERLRERVLLVRITSFTRGSGREVRAALAREPSAYDRGVILDLRGNSGGLLDEAVEVSSVFLDGGPVVSYERRGAAVRTLDAVGHGDATTPVVVLVDGGTASAAEVVAAALQDRNRAVVVGSRTFGKGSVQEPSRLSDGSGLELTVGRYLTPAGRAIDGVGVQPDVSVAADAVPALAERRAGEILTGLVAALAPGRG